MLKRIFYYFRAGPALIQLYCSGVCTRKWKESFAKRGGLWPQMTCERYPSSGSLEADFATQGWPYRTKGRWMHEADAVILLLECRSNLYSCRGGSHIGQAFAQVHIMISLPKCSMRSSLTANTAALIAVSVLYSFSVIPTSVSSRFRVCNTKFCYKSQFFLVFGFLIFHWNQ